MPNLFYVGKMGEYLLHGPLAGSGPLLHLTRRKVSKFTA
jgi:hypothetical protein